MFGKAIKLLVELASLQVCLAEIDCYFLVV